MDNLVMQGYKSGLKIVPTIPRYDNSGTEITDANYWPVPIDSVFRTNYGFNVYTGNGKLVTTTDTTKRFIVTDYGGFTPKNPQESYSAQELYNLVLDARGLTHGKNYALSILDSTTGKSGRVILTASDNTARLTYALTLQLEDANGNPLSNKAVAVNKCNWHILPDGTNTGTFSLEPNIVIPGMTLLNPKNLPTQIYLPDLLANVHGTRLQIENAASPVAAVFILTTKTESMPERMEVPARLLPVQAGDTDKDTPEPGTCCATH